MNRCGGEREGRGLAEAGFQAEGETAIIKRRSSVNGREGGVGMKRKKREYGAG